MWADDKPIGALIISEGGGELERSRPSVLNTLTRLESACILGPPKTSSMCCAATCGWMMILLAR